MIPISVCGHICVDLAPRLDSPSDLAPGALLPVGPLGMTAGGLVANCARVLGALGAEVHAHGAIGDDALGGEVLRALTEMSGVEPDLVVLPGGTSYSIVLESPGWDRSFLHHVGVNASFDGSGFAVRPGTLVHLGYPTLLPALEAQGGAGLVRLMQRIRAGGAISSLDLAGTGVGAERRANSSLALERALSCVDILCPSWDDLVAIDAVPSAPGESGPDADALGSFADLAVERGVALVVLSAGARGFLLATADTARLEPLGRVLAPEDPVGWARRWADVRLHRAPEQGVHVTTTLGAGDTLKAALLFALARGAGPRDAADFASATVAAHLEGRRLAERPSA